MSRWKDITKGLSEKEVMEMIIRMCKSIVEEDPSKVVVAVQVFRRN